MTNSTGIETATLSSATSVAIISIAVIIIGFIGVCFGAIGSLRLKEVYEIRTVTVDGIAQPLSWPAYNKLKEDTRTLGEVAAYRIDRDTVVTSAARQHIVDSVFADGSLFSVLGSHACLGKLENTVTQDEVAVVLSYDAWKDQFHSDTGIIGASLRVERINGTIIGVLAPGVQLPFDAKHAIYLYGPGEDENAFSRRDHKFHVVARLLSKRDPRSFNMIASQTLSNLNREFPQTDRSIEAKLEPISRSGQTVMNSDTLLVYGVLIVVALASLLGIHGPLRPRLPQTAEAHFRSCFSVGSVRIGQQLTYGSIVAWSCVAVLREPLLQLCGMVPYRSRETIAIIGAACVASSTIVGIRLAQRQFSRRGIPKVCEADSREMALCIKSLYLLSLTSIIAIGIATVHWVMIRHLWTSLGIKVDHVALMRCDTDLSKLNRPDMLDTVYQPLMSRIKQNDSQAIVGLTTVLPGMAPKDNSSVHVAGLPSSQHYLVESRFVTDDLYDALGIPLINGRKLTKANDQSDQPAASIVINQAFVSQFVPDGMDPASLRLDDSSKEAEWTRVVGVVADVRQRIHEDVVPERDYLMSQLDPEDRKELLTSVFFVAHTTMDNRTLLNLSKRFVEQTGAPVIFQEPITLHEYICLCLANDYMRFRLWMLVVVVSVVGALSIGVLTMKRAVSRAN